MVKGRRLAVRRGAILLMAIRSSAHVTTRRAARSVVTFILRHGEGLVTLEITEIITTRMPARAASSAVSSGYV